jgi:superfamily II DNA or RNA helicase
MFSNLDIINQMSNVFSEIEISRKKLRECQTEAFSSALQHYSKKNYNRQTLIQMPTGTGKSALIAILPFGLCKKKTLIITPNKALATQINDDLDITENPGANIYKALELLSDKELTESELFTLVLDSTVNNSDVDEHQIIIGNYHQLNDIEKFFASRSDDVDLVIIDEAHHQEANTYKTIIDFFSNAKIIGLTATPFRSDGKKLDGEKIYTYHFKDAIRDRIIRNIRTSNVSPEQVELRFLDEAGKEYSLSDIMKLKDDAWFRRSVAMSEDCCASIAQKAVEKLNVLKTKFPNQNHQIIAAAMTIRHAREFVKPAFERMGLKVGLVNSKETESDNSEVLDKLKKNKIDVIVNVGMLGEGFDHKPLGVAAIFKPFRSLNPYIQFIGRVIRKHAETNECWVVSHLGLNQIERFDEFKLFDEEDQDFISKLEISVDDSKGNLEDSFVNFDIETDTNNQKDEKLAAIRETGENLLDFSSDFIDLEDEKVKEALSDFANMDSAQKLKFLEVLSNKGYKVDSFVKKTPKPKNKRQASKNLLNEKAKSIVTDILKELNLKFKSRVLNPRFTDFAWIQRFVSKRINDGLGIQSKQRKNISNEQFKEIEESNFLDEVKRESQAHFKAKLLEKKKIV